MKELTRSNDLVYLSFVQDRLEQAGIDCLIFDQDNSLNLPPMIQQRIMVRDEDYAAAKQILENEPQP